MIITIDGPAGTGKSTVARKVAKRLGFTFYDTGAMYRSVAWLAIQSLENPLSEESIKPLLSNFHYEIRQIQGEERYFVNSYDVTDVIRSPEVTRLVSPISAYSSVREAMWKVQRECSLKGDAVFEGRDMGTVVFPDAEKKFFLTARPEVRAERRRKEYLAKEPALAQKFTHEEMLAEIQKRDAADSNRSLAPLKCPSDAVTIDTSDQSIDEVVERICRCVQKETRHMHWFYNFILTTVRWFFKLVYRHKVYGADNLKDGAALLCANHTSFYDPPIVAISSPYEVHFLARESLFKAWGFGALIRTLNSHPVSGDASDIAVIKTVISLLKSGKKIVLFPEGARSDTNTLAEIRPGVGLFVMKAHAPIVPIYISGAFGIWNRLRKLPKLKGRTACVFGTPIRYEEFLEMDKREAQKKIAERLYNSINALRAWYESGAKGTPP